MAEVMSEEHCARLSVLTTILIFLDKHWENLKFFSQKSSSHKIVQSYLSWDTQDSGKSRIALSCYAMAWS